MSYADDRIPAEAKVAEGDRVDLHSFSKPNQVRVEHVRLFLTVDFAKKELRGEAALRYKREATAPRNAPLVLDTRDLTIEAVMTDGDPHLDNRLSYTLGKADPILGAPLTIAIERDSGEVIIRYRTSPKASALQWLDAPRTAGRKHPFLFSQSQAIHARSWIPCQDSPGVRVTYDAEIRVPDGLGAVMAADRVRQQGNVTTFKMDKPIPSYLIALAVGDLVFRPIGKRTGVWAEPSVVDKAAYEFADTEKMVEAAEKRFGPYRWGRYDILVLPPSFPFGGMENPKLTFATPTVLAGDRSLVALIAHELAHSWSGNQVTGATWRDFWLNEGFTTYLENRIIEDLYGKDRATMEAVLGKQELREELAKFAPRDEILHVDLKGRDPDEGMTRVPYEKGALLLKRLEDTVGRDKFDAFLKGYFDHFAFKSLTTDDFTRYLRAELFPKGPEPVDLHAWIHNPGLPDDAPEPKSERFAAIDKLAATWSDGKVMARDLRAADWSTLEWLHFLRALPAKVAPEKMRELDNAYNLTDRGNSEIASQWLLLAIRNGYTGSDARLDDFLTSIGRRKFLMPLYTELSRTPAGKERARAIYKKARPFYHPIAVESVDKLLGVGG
ncbi:MAG: Peptidase rane alanine aminopeptidase [Planctomycetota bacterium]|nr:Peptidase rane alanine aminopeptidase [Planctomycetota bacterium]